eukprot:4576439-Alexandrium_andersonii.AAC.1
MEQAGLGRPSTPPAEATFVEDPIGGYEAFASSLSAELLPDTPMEPIRTFSDKLEEAGGRCRGLLFQRTARGARGWA